MKSNLVSILPMTIESLMLSFCHDMYVICQGLCACSLLDFKSNVVWHKPLAGLKVFRIIPEFRILRLTFLRKSASQY